MTDETSVQLSTQEPTQKMQEFELLQRQCKAWLASQLLPPTISDVAKAVTVVMSGAEMGVPPLTSLREINIVQGKPTFSAQLMLSLVYQKVPGAVVNFLTPVEKQGTECLVEAQRPGGKLQQFRFTLDMARAAGLLNKNNWKQHPEAMLRARAVAATVRAVFPDAVSSCYLPEEMGSVIDVSPDENEKVTGETDGGGVVEKSVNPTPPPKVPPQPERKLVTEKQLARLFAIARTAKWSNEDLHSIVFSEFGHGSLKQLDWVEYDNLCKYVEASKAGFEQAVEDDLMPFEK